MKKLPLTSTVLLVRHFLATILPADEIAIPIFVEVTVGFTAAQF